jgi:hypothetical protein
MPLEPSPPPPPPRRERSSRRDDYDDHDDREYDDYDDRPRRYRRRRDLAPHRGSTILTFGILSLVVFGPIFGPMAWIMGNNDLAEMKAGRMDPEGESATNAGRICGMIATIICIVGVALLCLCVPLAMMGRVR